MTTKEAPQDTTTPAVGRPVERRGKPTTDPRTLTTHSEVAAAVRRIQKARREAVRDLMRNFDKLYYLNLKDMRDACGRIGHKWRFTHLGPLSDPWFSCGVCQASECRPDRGSD